MKKLGHLSVGVLCTFAVGLGFGMLNVTENQWYRVLLIAVNVFFATANFAIFFDGNREEKKP